MAFFAAARDRALAEYEPLSVPRLATKKARAASVTLNFARQINGKNVRRLIAYWRSTGFIPDVAGKVVKRTIDDLECDVLYVQYNTVIDRNKIIWCIWL